MSEPGKGFVEKDRLLLLTAQAMGDDVVSKQTAPRRRAKKRKLKATADRGGRTQEMCNGKTKRRLWSEAEVDALRAGVTKHGPGEWRKILEDPALSPDLYFRAPGDLKDKWRGLSKRLSGAAKIAAAADAASAASASASASASAAAADAAARSDAVQVPVAMLRSSISSIADWCAESDSLLGRMSEKPDGAGGTYCVACLAMLQDATGERNGLHSSACMVQNMRTAYSCSVADRLDDLCKMSEDQKGNEQ